MHREYAWTSICFVVVTEPRVKKEIMKIRIQITEQLVGE